MSPDEVGRARPPGAPKHPQRKKLPHERPLWLRPEAQIFFITVCCEPRGKNQLCSPKVARAIFDSVEFRNQNFVWYAHLVCLMPDHLHALISFPYERPMKQVIADWKRFLTTNFKVEWQRDFFDHRLRKQESYREKADYIRANPVRAGLIESSEEWSYFWLADPQKENTNRKAQDRRDGAPSGRALPTLALIYDRSEP
jgi:putative transposase